MASLILGLDLATLVRVVLGVLRFTLITLETTLAAAPHLATGIAANWTTGGLMVALGVAAVSTGSSGGEEPGGAVALRARRVVRVVATTGPCFPDTAAATSFCLLPVFFPMVPNRRTRSQQFGEATLCTV